VPSRSYEVTRDPEVSKGHFESAHSESSQPSVAADNEARIVERPTVTSEVTEKRSSFVGNEAHIVPRETSDVTDRRNGHRNRPPTDDMMDLTERLNGRRNRQTLDDECASCCRPLPNIISQ
jgi:hypothetical protein